MWNKDELHISDTCISEYIRESSRHCISTLISGLFQYLAECGQDIDLHLTP